MKKYMIVMSFLFICSLFLIACTNNSNDFSVKNDTENDEVNEATETDKNVTSDPLDVMRDDRYDTFDNGAELEIVGRYISDQSDENGVIE